MSPRATTAADIDALILVTPTTFATLGRAMWKVYGLRSGLERSGRFRRAVAPPSRRSGTLSAAGELVGRTMVVPAAQNCGVKRSSCREEEIAAT